MNVKKSLRKLLLFEECISLLSKRCNVSSFAEDVISDVRYRWHKRFSLSAWWNVYEMLLSIPEDVSCHFGVVQFGCLLQLKQYSLSSQTYMADIFDAYALIKCAVTVLGNFSLSQVENTLFGEFLVQVMHRIKKDFNNLEEFL